MVSPSFFASALLCSSEIASALVADHGGCGGHCRRANNAPRGRSPSPSFPQPAAAGSSLLFSTASSTENKPSSGRRIAKGAALRLMEENAMPPPSTSKDDNQHDIHRYDEDKMSPIESEFMSLTSTFQSYSEQDIRSLTTTSTRYLLYHPPGDPPSSSSSSSQSTPKKKRPPKQPRRRSNEEGIRYRTLYSGVQAASLEPQIMRAFIVLFEDYAPIRLAGRKIYGHLEKVMEEVREERSGEVARAKEICPGWDTGDDRGGGGAEAIGAGETNGIERARSFWDTLVEEALLLDRPPGSAATAEERQSREGGVVSFSQLVRLGIDGVLVGEGLVRDTAELEAVVRRAAFEDAAGIERRSDPRGERGPRRDPARAEHLDVTFVIFARALYQQCAQGRSRRENDDRRLLGVLQKMEREASSHRRARRGSGKDTSTLLANKAVLGGSSAKCKKRQKYSNRYDEYVSKFNSWEQKFLRSSDGNDGNSNTAGEQHTLSRRFEILQGCFVGARNEKNAAALKIVYMDYAALRFGGDLIFQLMSKIADKIL